MKTTSLTGRIPFPRAAVLLAVCCVLFFSASNAEESVSLLPPAEGLWCNYETLTLYGGGTEQLEIFKDGLDYGRLEWVSSDPGIAAVESHGVVIALSEGTCTVTGTDPESPYESVSVPITVTSDRKLPSFPKTLQGSCYRNKKKASAGERKMLEEYARGLKAKADSGNATAGERIVLTALGYIGRPYGTKEGNVDCSMLLYWAAFDNGISVSRRSDWQAEELLPYAVGAEELEPGDFLFLAVQGEESCRCGSYAECTRYHRIHHAAIFLGEVNGTQWLIEASSRLGKVVIRCWDESSTHAGFLVDSIVRPATLCVSGGEKQ